MDNWIPSYYSTRFSAKSSDRAEILPDSHYPSSLTSTVNPVCLAGVRVVRSHRFLDGRSFLIAKIPVGRMGRVDAVYVVALGKKLGLHILDDVHTTSVITSKMFCAHSSWLPIMAKGMLSVCCETKANWCDFRSNSGDGQMS